MSLEPVTNGHDGKFRILGIETSCDETAAAIVADGTDVVSSVVSSQIDLHARFGGVVPEIASRAHVELLTPVVARCLVESGLEGNRARCGGRHRRPRPGRRPAGGGEHGQGPLSRLGGAVRGHQPHGGPPLRLLPRGPALRPPLLVLLVSGGHTMLVLMDDHGKYRLVGTTVDDAVGEAFDKVARYLGLGYPGGPAIDRLAIVGDPNAVPLPRPMPEGFDFSFSGLKTAVIRYVKAHPDVATADVAASFQKAAVELLVDKARRAARETGATTLCLGGGVAANSLLRERILDICEEDGLDAFLPSREMCTDNAAMVAAAAWWRYKSDGPSPLDMASTPTSV